MIRTALLALLAALTPSISRAVEYGHYDLNRIRTISETSSGKKYAIDRNYLDEVLRDLGFHARNYPPQFDTQQDQKRAAQDVIFISGIMNAVQTGTKPDTELLLRAAYLGMLGKNLNIPGSSEIADSNFNLVLKAEPNHPQGNFLFGVHLAGKNKLKKAIPYLEKAIAAGITDASFTLGMVYKSLGNKKKAIFNLQVFRKSSPYNEQIADLAIAEIEAVKVKKKGGKK